VVGGSNGAISGSLGGDAVARNPCDSWAFFNVLLCEALKLRAGDVCVCILTAFHGSAKET